MEPRQWGLPSSLLRRPHLPPPPPPSHSFSPFAAPPPTQRSSLLPLPSSAVAPAPCPHRVARSIGPSPFSASGTLDVLAGRDFLPQDPDTATTDHPLHCCTGGFDKAAATNKQSSFIDDIYSPVWSYYNPPSCPSYSTTIISPSILPAPSDVRSA